MKVLGVQELSPWKLSFFAILFDLIHYLKENPLKNPHSLAFVLSICFEITFEFSRILFAESCQLKI